MLGHAEVGLLQCACCEAVIMGCAHERLSSVLTPTHRLNLAVLLTLTVARLPVAAAQCSAVIPDALYDRV